MNSFDIENFKEQDDNSITIHTQIVICRPQKQACP